ncbi:phosphate/phosphite/phosphonate ABC transporter substrate-binding protein [Paraneptunicella aestuarii]|uniref:PhnD/SsuA/transferrin family substrate-binding protein n=1 Tax=Paraneptunicella aestuarii TaxID=2831148 RepID=UPI001E4AFB4F|nr:PhnD/SsuA/transferrin family substrate-binding protein [Paraneptunicella aestuarii]UAA40489.1 phosphate/phosphite/phosphonate ABC transporter substrate-binding protein [Paraneptunicella aestuarii]
MRIIVLIYFVVTSNLVFAETYTFAFVPQQSAKKMAKKWQPILDYLSEKTGDDYRFTTAKDIPTFEKRLASNTYDVAYMNPYHFTVFNVSPGYQALVKQKDKRITGIIVVHKDSPIKTLEELNGATIAFPAPAAFAATLLTSAEFRKKGISIYPQYVSSHDSVYLNVSRGFMVAGGGVSRTFYNADKAVQDKLRILLTTPQYTPHAFAVKSSLPEAVVNRLKLAMVHMHESELGGKLLKSVNFNGFEAATNADWDDVRALGIDIINQ